MCFDGIRNVEGERKEVVLVLVLAVLGADGMSNRRSDGIGDVWMRLI